MGDGEFCLELTTEIVREDGILGLLAKCNTGGVGELNRVFERLFKPLDCLRFAGGLRINVNGVAGAPLGGAAVERMGDVSQVKNDSSFSLLLLLRGVGECVGVVGVAGAVAGETDGKEE